MTRSDLDDLVSVEGKPSFQPIPSMMVGPTEIRADNKECENCGEYFGSGLSLSHPRCVKCETRWPQSAERPEPKCHETWWEENTYVLHVVKACFDGEVHHYPIGQDGEPIVERAGVTDLPRFMETFRFREAAPGERYELEVP